MSAINGTAVQLPELKQTTYRDGDAEQVAFRIIAELIDIWFRKRWPALPEAADTERWKAVELHLRRIREHCLARGMAGL